MGMGHSANYAEIITLEDMRKLLPKEMSELENSIEEEFDDVGDIESFFSYSFEDYPESNSVKALKKLQEAFEKLTTVGTGSECLKIYVAYHNREEEGDRYDDVDGAFFIVTGVYQLTAPAQKFKDFIKRALWTTFG